MDRKHSIDILRMISAVAVVIIHIISSPVTNRNFEISAKLIINLNLIHTLMNWAVPVFFMITGYCLLKKKDCTYRYCFSHVLKYVCILFTVGLFYALLEEIFVTNTINFSVFLKSLLNVISGNLWDHMWYVYSIIGIYLVMPVIHHFFQQRENNFIILTILLFVFNILFPTIEQLLPIGVNIPFGSYLFYVCFGAAIAKIEINKIFSYIVYLLGLLSSVWIIMTRNSHSFGYTHLTVCLMAMSIFLFFSQLEVSSNKLMLCISKCTWGIYLIHPFFINTAIKLLKIDVLSAQPYLRLFALFVIVFIASFLSTYVLRKIPLIKKLF